MALSKIVRDSLNTGIDDNSDATAITIDSSERVGVSTTAMAANLEVGSASSKINALTVKTATGSGGVAGISFMAGQTTAGREKAAMFFKETNGGAHYTGDLVFAIATSSGSAAQVAASDEVCRITSSGITFNGDTAAANALDDYEVGTWTPTFLASGTNPTVNSVGNNTGYYVKVGDIVHFSYYTAAMNIGSAGSGAAYVGNLPFTSSNGTNEYWLFQYVHGTAIGSSVTGGYINNHQTAITFILPNSTGGVSWNAGNPQYMMIAGSYRAA